MCETPEKMDLLAATEWKSGGNLASDPRIRCQNGNRMKHEDSGSIKIKICNERLQGQNRMEAETS